MEIAKNKPKIESYLFDLAFHLTGILIAKQLSIPHLFCSWLTNWKIQDALFNNCQIVVM